MRIPITIGTEPFVPRDRSIHCSDHLNAVDVMAMHDYNHHPSAAVMSQFESTPREHFQQLAIEHPNGYPFLDQQNYVNKDSHFMELSYL